MRGKNKTHEREPLRCYRYDDGAEGVAERARQREEEFACDGRDGRRVMCEGEGIQGRQGDARGGNT